VGNFASLQLEEWNNGIMGSWIGVTLKEVGGASAYGRLEAEGQEFFASCLSEAILKRSAPEPEGPLFQLLIPNIPTFHRSRGLNSQSELVFPIFQRSPPSSCAEIGVSHTLGRSIGFSVEKCRC
jgi:hypothetical protein